MSLTAVITNHNYAQHLKESVGSALEFCDEVLVYDDGSTDGSLDVLAGFGDRITVTHRETASGTPIWGSTLGIRDATSTHLIFLDADNRLISTPPVEDVDYCFASIAVNDVRPRTWDFSDWPTDPDVCWVKLCDHARRRVKPLMPFPWGGVWRTRFLRGKSWRPFETTTYAPDLRTAMDWVKHRPRLAFHPTPFLEFRKHAGQMSGPSPQRRIMLAELKTALESEDMPRTGDPDVVYTVRAGENEELRWSMRSLANLPHDRVWVFGHKPGWCSARHVPVIQRGTRWENTTAAIEAACSDDRVSDPFVLMNDDFFLLGDCGLSHSLGSLEDVACGYRSRGNHSRYVSDMEATTRALRSEGLPALSYDAHTPLLVHKAPMLEAIAFCRRHRLEGAFKRSVYGNMVGLEAETLDLDVKVYHGCKTIPEGPLLSSDDVTFARVEHILRETFPERGRWETEGPPAPVMVSVTNTSEHIRQRAGYVFRPGIPVQIASPVPREVRACRDLHLSCYHSEKEPKTEGGHRSMRDILVSNASKTMVVRGSKSFPGRCVRKQVSVSDGQYREIKAHKDLTVEPVDFPACPECHAPWVEVDGEMVQEHTEDCTVPDQIEELRPVLADEQGAVVPPAQHVHDVVDAALADGEVTPQEKGDVLEALDDAEGPTDTSDADDGLDDLKLEELKDLAEAEEVAVSGRKKAEYVAAIRAKRAE